MTLDRVRLVLRALGAFNSQHSGRKLADHLLGTYAILAGWGCDEDVCTAGAFHSIFATNVFKRATIAATDETHKLLSELIGERAANLAWLFAKIDRPHGLERGAPRDHRTKTPVTVSAQELHDLRLIEAANLIEQGCGLEKFPRIAALVPKVAA